MMHNQLPENTPMSAILDFIEHKSSRNGKRDRCIFVLRQVCRIRDLVGLYVFDVLNTDGSVKSFIKTRDEKRIDLSADIQQEIADYLSSKYSVDSLEDLPIPKFAEVLFTTQKKPLRGFSLNTMAQHHCLTDAAIRHQFTQPKAPAKPVFELAKLLNDARHSDIAPSAKKSLLERFTASFA